jgi:uncharacterized membrane protein
MSPELDAVVYLILRWLHIASGITWVGHLYFLTLVNAPLQGALDPEARKRLNPPLLSRAYFWFRWGAMSTLVFGLGLFYHTYWNGGALYDADGVLSQRGAWMLFGAALGILMWANVWFLIWPAQKRLLARGEWESEESQRLARRALRLSRVTVWLSAPMLMGMIAAPNVSAWSLLSGTVHVLVILSTLVIVHLAFRLAGPGRETI